MSNTIEEILKSKNIFEYYVEKLCIDCSNKDNTEDLCRITRRIDNTVHCINYSRCMQRKCKDCRDENKCFKEEKERC